MQREKAVAAIQAVIDTGGRELVLDWATHLVDADFELLSQAITLEKLVLPWCQVENRHAPHIAALINLVELGVPINHVNSGIREFVRLPRLERLDISDDIFLHDDHVQPLIRCPRLAWINASRTSIGDLACLALSHIGTLRGVDVADTDVTDGGIVHFERMPLDEIGLGRKITDNGLNFLPKTVKTVRIDGREITERGIESFCKKHRDIEHFRLYLNGPGNFMQWIGLLTRLKSLEVIGDMTDDQLSRNLPRLPDMESLFVSGHGFTNAWVPALESCRRLTHLSVSGLEFNDGAVPALSRLDTLEDLNLNCTEVSYPRGVTTLRAALPKCNVRDIRARIGRRHAM